MTGGTVLVTGAGGYVGGRLVPRLLAEGYTVRASFTDPASAGRMPWAHDVEVVGMDATERADVAAAVRGVDAVVYLVHGMGRGADFAETDRRAARLMAEAVDLAGVGRLVYVSGLQPRPGRGELSEHLRSRLEVERLLSGARARVVTLRAAIVLGSGSTSFEVVRQISERVPVQPVPLWAFSKVQPVAVVDLLEALLGALSADVPTRSYDVGGPDRLSYPRLLATYARVAGLVRAQVPVPLAPSDVVATLTGALTDVPATTVESLVDSLRHDMVCREDDAAADLLPGGYRMVGLDEAIRRSLAPPDPHRPDPMAALPTDPPWASGGRRGVAAGAAVLGRLARAGRDAVTDTFAEGAALGSDARSRPSGAVRDADTAAPRRAAADLGVDTRPRPRGVVRGPSPHAVRKGH